MDFWPSSSWTECPSAKNGTKTKRPVLEESSYPLINQGDIGAANICRRNGQINWSFVKRAGSVRKVVVNGYTSHLFPPTFRGPYHNFGIGIKQRAEQGAHFLRTHFPDIEITSDLIREELEVDAREAKILNQFDPFAGNLLTSFTCDETSRRKASYLAFPTGEASLDLNVSSFRFSRSEVASFVPTTDAMRSFPTPIRQIVSSDGHATSIYAGYLGVRTHGVTSLIGVKSQWQNLELRDITSVKPSKLGARPIMDMVFTQPSPNDNITLMLVDNGGDIYSVNQDGLRTVMYRNSKTADDQKYWKVARATNQRAVLLLSNSNLRLLDFRSASDSLDILSCPTPGSALIYTDNINDGSIIRVVSTHELYWMDQRYPRRPLLSIKHNHRSDNSLRLHTMSFNEDPVTLLTSAKNDLVTVYDVSSGDDTFTHLNTAPYLLNRVEPYSKRRVGRDVLQYPSQLKAMVLSLLQDGSINCVELQVLPSSSPDSSSSTGSVRCEWSPTIQALSERAADSSSHLGPLGSRERNEQDMEPPYRRILGLEDILDTDHAQVYESVESMRSFWQEFDAPAEHLLTTFDITFRSGNEPKISSRADFLTQNAFNSKRGFRAVMQQRIPMTQISAGSAWRYNLTPTSRALVPALGEHPQETWQNLSQYDLLEDDYRSGPSIRRETQAREQLVVDLTLSGDVFSPYAVRGPQVPADVDEAVETMSRAAEAMSIGIPEPPPIHFGFLRPVQTRGIDHYDTERTAEGPQQSLSICLLLQEWTVGEDVAGYSYSDPYDSSTPMLPKHSRTSTRAQGDLTDTVAVSHGPPAIATASQPFTPHPVVPPIASSQPTLVNSKIASFTQSQRGKRLLMDSQPISFDMSPQASQEIVYPSTQILPGPFGGRPVAKPKATKKKRVGGF